MNYELKKWTMPNSYFGEVWPNWYVSLTQTRDSDCLTRSNFTCFLKDLGGESDTVQVVRENHWACGWVEWIAIHQDDEEALMKARAIFGLLNDYPVVDEDHFSQLEYDEAMDTWRTCYDMDEKKELCTKYECTLPDDGSFPIDDDGSLMQSLTN